MASRPIPTARAVLGVVAASTLALAGCDNPFTAAAALRDDTALHRVEVERAYAGATVAGALLVPPPPAALAKPPVRSWHGRLAGRMSIVRPHPRATGPGSTYVF